MSHDGLIASNACSDGTIRLLDRQRGELSQKLSGAHKQTEYRIECKFTYDDAVVVVGCETGSVVLYDVLDAKAHTLTGHTHTITAIDTHPSQSSIASSSLDGTVRVWM